MTITLTGGPYGGEEIEMENSLPIGSIFLVDLNEKANYRLDVDYAVFVGMAESVI